MDHATARAVIHWHAAVSSRPFVTGAVAVTHAAGDHVRDGLEAAVRMIRKPADVVLRVVGAERVEHEERIEPALQRLREHALSLTPAPSDVGWPCDDGARRRAGVSRLRCGESWTSWSRHSPQG